MKHKVDKPGHDKSPLMTWNSTLVSDWANLKMRESSHSSHLMAISNFCPTDLTLKSVHYFQWMWSLKDQTKPRSNLWSKPSPISSRNQLPIMSRSTFQCLMMQRNQALNVPMGQWNICQIRITQCAGAWNNSQDKESMWWTECFTYQHLVALIEKNSRKCL